MNHLTRVLGGVAVAFLCAVSGAFGAEGVPTLVQVGTTNGQAQVDLSWASDADTFYEIYSATNLAAGPWTLAVAEPLASTNLIGTLRLLSADKSRFFQVRKLDTQGPAITARYPAAGDANVGLAAALSVSVSDPSGIATNTFRVSVNGGVPLPLGGAGISVTANGFTYDPALAATNWGGNGATVTVSFACADLKGNATSEEWSFYLEVPITVADNILVLGDAPQNSYAVVRPTVAAGRTAASLKPTLQPLTAGLAIVAIYPDRVVVSYTGDSHGIALGALLANSDFNNIFYRRVTGLSDNPAVKRVTVYTEDVPFTHLITDGSFDSSAFVVVGGEGLSALGVSPLDTFEMTKQYSASGTYSVSRNWGPVTFNGSAGYSLNGGMDFSTRVEWLKLKQMTAGVYAGLDVNLNGALVFDATTEPIDESLPLFGESLLLVRVKGLIYGIPVIVSLYLDMDLCVESESTGAVTLSAGAAASASFTNRITFSGGTWKREPEKDAVKFSCTMPRPVLSGGMEGHIQVYLMPKLTLRLYEVVGVGLDYRRGPLVTGSYSASEGRFHFSLYDKRSVNLSLWCTDLPNVLEGVIDPDNLPEWNLWTAPDELKSDWYWPEVSESAPVFSQHPSGQTAAQGATVTLSASASGNPAPEYQWYQNGVLRPGATAATLTFTMGASAVGNYCCTANNRLGTATSQSAAVSLPATAPTGMALIPAGSFQMGDNLDGLSSSMPVHTVYVGAFYMDKYEVTWAKWNEVRDWAVNNGYDLSGIGAGKTESHPVQTVSWYDCVKWCNARSQKEGKPYVYYTDAGFTAVYKTGSAVYPAVLPVYCKWSASGYRLPTEAEWEKAARGGLSGRRFPWGDRSDHTRANYYGYWSGGVPVYPYDDGYSGYDTRYITGGYPYTSPAGTFSPNGYGLHDMSGNVWEWCWDWYGSAYYGTSPLSNPSGPASGSFRVIRGGSWYYSAIGCRSAYRNFSNPDYRYFNMGFRAVLPPGQQ